VAKYQYLSKTDFIRFLTCPAWAWVERHQPERIPSADPSSTRAIERGKQVEALAIQRFPNGHLIESRRMDVAAKQTRDAIRRGVRTIYQATALTSFGLIAQADILHRDEDGWHMYEVKSSTSSKSDPRKIQKRFLEDIAFQVHAFTDFGLDIASASIIHLDGAYRRNGTVDIDRLFHATDLTKEIRGVYETLGRAIESAYFAMNDTEREPTCTCHMKARANRCDLFSTFHPEFPEFDSVLDLRVSKDKLQRALDLGITSLLDWPDDIPLTDNQRETVRFRRSGDAVVDVTKLRTILGGYQYPLYFYDYETYAAPIPLHEGIGPYEAVPFQYSLHIVTGEGDVSHHEFLWTERGTDPVPLLATQLLSQIGDVGTLVAWNAGYEKGCNTRMAERHPQFREAFANLNARTVDLGDIVKQDAWKHPKFRGSWSLKNVVPVVDPALDYRYLDIGEGGFASERWMQAVLDDESLMVERERESIFEALRTYCHRDTLAMVHVWHKANELAGHPVTIHFNQ
jgi:hypothetical protein